jgi:alginate O-acetyltransferase complex protein AlgI
VVFSSAIFLYTFLPITIILYYILKAKYRNILLLLASLIFYAWGEPIYVLLMIASIGFNWIIGIAIQSTSKRQIKKSILLTGVSVNLLVLIYYKYAFFLLSSLNTLIPQSTLTPHPIVLPIGISFFTFHAISYLIDIHRHDAHALKNPLDMGLYISLFPQLVAGPIIRYHDIAAQIIHRKNTLDRFSSGIERFVYGLAKKVLIANALGEIADQAFNAPPSTLSMEMAWLGILCYSLQIYFDFSGYSDMAIGLARLFGFELTENFNYPYISRSIREFWRRWHISLSTWFRDYLYIPLGGNHVSPLRVKINLLIVFLLCGLWHGASWNFVLWGALHGILLTIERGRFGAILDHAPRPLSTLYTLLAISLTWVFFRANDIDHALTYLAAMAGNTPVTGIAPQMAMHLHTQTLLTLLIAIALSTPIAHSLTRDAQTRRFPQNPTKPAHLANTATLPATAPVAFLRTTLVTLIFLLCTIQLAVTTYNPFIYFRF